MDRQASFDEPTFEPVVSVHSTAQAVERHPPGHNFYQNNFNYGTNNYILAHQPQQYAAPRPLFYGGYAQTPPPPMMHHHGMPAGGYQAPPPYIMPSVYTSSSPPPIGIKREDDQDDFISQVSYLQNEGQAKPVYNTANGPVTYSQRNIL